MLAPRVLFVKLSSLGDVIHHLPAVSDLATHRPGARIHWAVEEAYADLVTLHPAVELAVPVNLRRLRRSYLSPSAWKGFAASRRSLARGGYDYVVDTQGLMKSATLARLAHSPCFGFDRASAREPLAARLYDVKIAVPRSLHAVERNRRLVAEVFGYAVDSPPDYGLIAPDEPPAWAPAGPYVVAFHAASRAGKLWPGERWIALGGRLAADGIATVFPGGNEAEREFAARLASATPESVAAPAMTLVEVAALVAHAEAVAGVDTGLTHLAVALDCPAVGIYCATDPALTGLNGAGRVVNLGSPGEAPSVDAVAEALGIGPRPG